MVGAHVSYENEAGNPGNVSAHLAHEPIHEAEGVEGDGGVRQLIAVVRGNLPLISVIVTSTLAIAVATTLLMTPRFTAVTTVQINDQTAQVLGKVADDETEATQMSSAQETERFLQTQIEILNSRALASRVAKRLGLVGNRDFYVAMGRRFPGNAVSPREFEEQAILMLLKAEDSTLPHNSRLATISFTAPDPYFAARVANAWAAEFIQANLQRRYDSSAYARDFIQGQLADAKAKLEKSERDLNEYARQQGLIKTRDPNTASAGTESVDGTVPNSVTTASLLQLNYLANQATQQRITAEQRWSAVAGSNLLNAPEVLNNQAIQSLMSERARDDADLQRERAKHFDDYPAVQQLKAQMASINGQIDAVAKNIRNSIKQQYDTAVEAENRLKAQVADLKGTSLAEQDRSVQYNLMARDADTNLSLYESLLQRYKELNAAAGISASNIAIIESAENPIEPSSPNLLLNLAIGLGAGLLLSVVVVMVRVQLDDAVRVPEDIENKLGIPLLGVIPKSQCDVPLDELDDPKSSISEAYNSLRGSLMFATAHGLPRTILVTSSQPAEGKSTSSLSIARGIAKIGRSVVLIDIDMRRPSLHAALGLDNRRGLSTVLSSQDSPDDVLRETIYPGLKVITSGPIPPSPTDLLNSTSMEALLDDLTKRFDIVLLDGPPVLGLADAPMLAPLVEGVLLVVQAERGHRGALRSSLRRLHANHANILGGILTMFDPAKSTSRYSEYYGYAYYQYSESKPD